MAKRDMETPQGWRSGSLRYGSGLTLEKAKKMLQAAEEEADRQGIPMAIAIADAGGNLLAFHRMDDAILVSINVAVDKAFTAVFGKLPTHCWFDKFRNGELPSSKFNERWIALPGGFPLAKNGEIMGGIGASGGVEREDICVARAALAAGGFDLNEADARLAEISRQP